MQVYLEHGIAAQLASSCVLERLAAHCSLLIDAAEVLEMRSEVECTGRNERLRAQIEQLLQRLSSGQSAGKYRTHLNPSPNVPDEHRHVVTPEELCLYDAMHFGENGGAPICCDDRFMQAYQHTGKSPIVGITDLLHHFLARGVINEATFFDWLLKLRGANARYLPPSTAEILHHLRRAPIRDGELQETPALRTLRRSVAAMLLDRDCLQEPFVNEHGEQLLREMELPVVCHRAATNALAKLWAEKESLDDIAARADWLWASLLVDARVFRQCFKSLQSPESDLQLLGMAIGMFYTQGLQLVGSRAERTGVRRRFFDWLTGRALTPVSRNTPRLVETVAQNIVDLLAVANEGIDEARKKHGERSPEAMAPRILIGGLIMDLPKDVAAKMKLSSESLERWGLHRQEPGMVVGGMTFTQREFWAAVSRVVKNGGATLITPDGKDKLRLAGGPKPNTLCVGKDGVLEIQILDLFHPEIGRRLGLLRSHPWWFDLDVAEREQAIERIVAEKLPSNRVALLDTHRDDSMANFYSRLRVAFRKNKCLGIDDLMPDSLGALRRFLRQSASGAAAESGLPSDPSTRLLANEGLEETISRLSCLPSALPSAVLAEFDALDSMDRDRMIESIERKPASFTQRLHIGRLWIRASAGSDRHLERVKKLVGFFCDAEKGGAEARAFSAILRWVHLRLSWMEEARAWSPDMKLRAVWTHAAQLQAVFATGGPSNGLAEWFSAHCREIDADQADATTRFGRDVCHPRNVDQGGLVIRGLAFLLDDAPEETLAMSGVRESLSHVLDQPGDGLAGSLSLWRPVARQTNQLASFLAVPREVFLPRLLKVDSFKKHFDFDAAAMMQTALNQLQQRPADAGLWTLIEFLGGSANLDDAEKGYVSRALPNVDLSNEFKANRNLPELIMIACQHATALGDAAIKSNLRAQLFKLANVAASLPTADQAERGKQVDWRRLGGALLDAVWKLNVVHDNPVNTTSAFLTDAGAILRAWPALAAQCRPSLTSLVTQLPVECQSAWIPLQLELRALAYPFRQATDAGRDFNLSNLEPGLLLLPCGRRVTARHSHSRVLATHDPSLNRELRLDRETFAATSGWLRATVTHDGLPFQLPVEMQPLIHAVILTHYQMDLDRRGDLSSYTLSTQHAAIGGFHYFQRVEPFFSNFQRLVEEVCRDRQFCTYPLSTHLNQSWLGGNLQLSNQRSASELDHDPGLLRAYGHQQLDWMMGVTNLMNRVAFRTRHDGGRRVARTGLELEQDLGFDGLAFHQMNRLLRVDSCLFPRPTRAASAWPGLHRGFSELDQRLLTESLPKL